MRRRSIGVYSVVAHDLESLEVIVMKNPAFEP